MNLAVIPARGGSKRIPGKNIRPFLGKPLISYSIEAAKRTELFDRIIVSTDSEQIAETAREYGAEAPFMRPAEIADDFTPTQNVLSHAINFISEKTPVDYMCCIYATAPLISPKYIKQGYSMLLEKDANTVFSVTTFPHPIFRAYKINPDGFVQMIWPEHGLTRSNDLPETYHDAGQIYWIKGDNFIKTGKMISKKTIPLILPRYLVQDIDTQEDWETAELMYENCKAKGLI